MATTSSAEAEPLITPRQVHESDGPLDGELRQRSQGRWKAHPYWVIPIVLVASMARGMTTAARINVYNEISCRAIDGATTNIASSLLEAACQSPEARARASKIQASIITIMSILSSGSTGLWSQWGDVRGRKIIFCVSITGFIAMETVFILVSGSVPAIARRAETFILLGPVLEGICGGLSVFNGVVHAYVYDCTPDGSRSKVFSAIQGMVSIGLAFGPWFAGVLFSFTNLETYSLFYISVAIQLVLLTYIIFLFPESLRSRADRCSPDPIGIGHNSNAVEKETLRELVKRFTVAFFSPITIFRPRIVVDGVSTKRNWNVTLMGGAMFLYIIASAVYPVKFLYAQHTFSWDSIQLGYYMSLLWVLRGINLLIVLPIIVSYFKPQTPIEGAASPESIALELRFDQRLAQGSLSLEALAHLLVALSPASSQTAFVMWSCLSSFTSGGNPALHSLGAVSLHALGYGSETGRLFGAVGVLSAIGHIISPSIFAVTYSLTLSGPFPRTIFYVASSLLIIGVILLTRIRVRG
ncbi:major facilitator superfamily domain-containing protein [Mycena alexandri]|uniref:Major facilitator superfamily domain-containing protein n=1 Tax=Mycena alexandri TaxID=1745969 RepID=A0AAD6WML2_9AGAR|nr:major facilitator superfamily domain-containing protein [Mycena alexandri]KAJ7030470.1 major facilitator superfamily domain-containing protein [Mycena alexandri]